MAGTAMPGAGRSRYDHACTSVETFAALICVRGEWRVPARSRWEGEPPAFWLKLPGAAGRSRSLASLGKSRASLHNER